MIFWLVLTGFAVAGGLFWLKGRLTRPPRHPVDDPEELAAAERDVRDLDAFSSPDDADDQIPDWGPGAP